MFRNTILHLNGANRNVHAIDCKIHVTKIDYDILSLADSVFVNCIFHVDCEDSINVYARDTFFINCYCVNYYQFKLIYTVQENDECPTGNILNSFHMPYVKIYLSAPISFQDHNKDSWCHYMRVVPPDVIEKLLETNYVEFWGQCNARMSLYMYKKHYPIFQKYFTSTVVNKTKNPTSFEYTSGGHTIGIHANGRKEILNKWFEEVHCRYVYQRSDIRWDRH